MNLDAPPLIYSLSLHDALPISIIHTPAVVILDEPPVGLDPIQIREIRQLIIQLGTQHGVILSTHILPEVQAVCSHVQIINQGQLVFSDSMKSLNHQMQCNQLLVAFSRPPDENDLLELTGVKQLDNLQNGRFRLHMDDTPSIAELIVSASVTQNWGLIELTPEKQSLEQIFVELTSRDISKEQAA